MMFTNKDYVSGHILSISLNYSSSPLANGLGRVDKDTGRLAVVDTNGSFSQWFAAGDGDLYKILFDTTAASTPTGLSVADDTFTTLDIDWSNSSDAQSGIDYYVVYRDGVEIDTITDSYFVDSGLLPGTVYSYRISVVNGEGIESALSSLLWGSTVKLPGDANNDGIVDDADAALLAANWLKMSGASWEEGDFNGDNKVDDADAAILAGNWQVGASSSASVPEPGMIVLLASMLFVVIGEFTLRYYRLR
jgi:hypothetical protein